MSQSHVPLSLPLKAPADTRAFADWLAQVISPPDGQEFDYQSNALARLDARSSSQRGDGGIHCPPGGASR
jgi:hypothetical protein